MSLSPNLSNALTTAQLYLVATPRPQQSQTEFVQRLEAALAGGVQILQLRCKGWDALATLHLAEQVQQLCRQAQVPFILNDRPDLAHILRADGVHLGQQDVPPSRLLGLHLPILGRSTHAPNEAIQAVQDGVHYLGVGPVWETPTKAGRRAVGLDYVRWAANHLSIPWFAIGGIDLCNVAEVLAAGAQRVAVVRAILDAKQPEQAAAQFRQLLAQFAVSGERYAY